MFSEFGGFCFALIFFIVGLLAIKFPAPFSKILFLTRGLEGRPEDYTSFMKIGGKIFLGVGTLMAMREAYGLFFPSESGFEKLAWGLLFIAVLLAGAFYLAIQMYKKKAYPLSIRLWRSK